MMLEAEAINQVTNLALDIRDKMHKELPELSLYKAGDLLIGKMRSEIGKLGVEYPATMGVIHGEFKHTWRIPSKIWNTEFSIGKINIEGHDLYFDPIANRYTHVEYNEYPDLYCGPDIPWWFYPDSRNPYWWGDSASWHNFVSFWQYKVWGKICDKIG